MRHVREFDKNRKCSHCFINPFATGASYHLVILTRSFFFNFTKDAIMYLIHIFLSKSKLLFFSKMMYCFHYKDKSQSNLPSY